MTTPQSAAIVTTPRDSGLGMADGDAFDAIKADLNTLWNSPGTVLFSGNLNMTGQNTGANSWLYQASSIATGRISGVTTGNVDSGTVSPFNIYINQDTVDTTTSGPGFLTYWSVKGVVSTGCTGGRTALQGSLFIHGTPSVLTGKGYVGVIGITNVAANLGGINNGVIGGYAGNCFGGNSNIFTGPTATYVALINGHEFDVAVTSPASTASLYGLTVIKSGDSRGVYDDGAICVGLGGTSTTTWKTVFQVGGNAQNWPCAADSTIFGAIARQYPAPNSPIALYGIDLRAVAFQSGGAAFTSTGFQVDPTGQVVTQVATVSTLPTGILGGRAFVTDATQTMTAGIGAVVAGGGGNKVPVFWDGTNWRIG